MEDGEHHLYRRQSPPRSLADRAWPVIGEDAGFPADSLTLQPGKTQSSLNLTWYAPADTAEACVKFGGETAPAVVSELHTPTNEMQDLEQVKTTFRGQNSGTSQSHGNYIQATAEEITNGSDSNGVTPSSNGYYDFTERREIWKPGATTTTSITTSCLSL